MLNDVIGCKEWYDKIANLVPSDAVKLLDLGCGSGLELQKILKLNPNIEVAGIDLSQDIYGLSKFILVFQKNFELAKNADVINC